MYSFLGNLVHFQGDTVTFTNPCGRPISGVRELDASRWNLITNDEGGVFVSHNPYTVMRYYRIEPQGAEYFAGGRFVVFNDGTCEVAQHGSGRPTISESVKRAPLIYEGK